MSEMDGGNPFMLGVEGTARSAAHLELRLLLEALPVAAYLCDRDGLIPYYNQPAVALWGRAPAPNDPKDRWCGSFRLFSSSGVPIAHEESWMAQTVHSGQPHYGHELVVERPDGLVVPVLVYTNPLFDTEGRVTGAVNLLIDVSNRSRADETQSRLGAIVESSDDAIISMTLEGVIVSWNAAATRIFGYTADEAVGRSITLIVPKERQGEEISILARLRRGERVEHFETVRLAKHGERLNISLTISPVHDATGRVIGASKVARDITLRKRDEDAFALLHEMSMRLSTALDLGFILQETLRTAAAIQGTARGLLSVTDGTRQHLEVGATLGYDEGQLAAVRQVESGDGSCGRCFEARRRISIEDVETDPLAVRIRAASRRAGIRAIHSTPLITRSGKMVGVLSTHFSEPRRPDEREMKLVDLCARQAVDFLENARLYTELREADRAKNEFLATLAHELRNPLAPIRNTIETLLLTGAPAAELPASLGVIRRQVTQMTRLIDDLLDISRITRTKLELRRERLDLAEVLHAAVESGQPLLSARAHDFSVMLPPEPIVLEGDFTRLAQVIANLLHNAAKYTERGGRIRLAARRDGAEAIITVRDNGMGIPAPMQEKIFEMFAQVNRSLEQGGLGIGLHLARRLVEMHGGTLTGTSAGEGKGSEFTVRLPLPRNAERPQRKRSEPELPAGSRGGPGLRIMVVDDSRDSADSLGRLLQIAGHGVHVAYDGFRAIELAEEHRPDVVLLDIGLPRMDGYETARRIRAAPWSGGMTLIALTGWGQEEAKERSRQAGFNDHFVKPVDPALLLRKLAVMHAVDQG